MLIKPKDKNRVKNADDITLSITLVAGLLVVGWVRVGEHLCVNPWSVEYDYPLYNHTSRTLSAWRGICPLDRSSLYQQGLPGRLADALAICAVSTRALDVWAVTNIVRL